MRITTLGGLCLISSLLTACATDPTVPVYSLTTEQAAANRAAINQIEDDDLAREHVERMRQVEAIERINRSTPPVIIY